MNLKHLNSKGRNSPFCLLFWVLALGAFLGTLIFYQYFLPSNYSVANHVTILPQTKFSHQWTNVSLGGGGYVTGIYLHPQEPDLVYIRTDIGGFFRWDVQAKKWIPLVDNFPTSESHYYGGEALALDPKDANVVYIAAGLYLSGKPGSIFKSIDKGKTWQKLNLQLAMGGSEDKRWTGNRLVVSPHNSKLILFGSRQDGLWRSTNAGESWEKVSALKASPEPTMGILAIAFDPIISGKVYLSAFGDGIYESTDNGVTWEKLKNSPPKAMKLAVAKDSTLYATSEVTPGVSKYLHGTWQDITPKGYSNRVFNGLSVHPTAAQELIVSLGEISSAKIFHSQDGGNNWSRKNTIASSTVPWWGDNFFADHTSEIQLDPHISNRVWLTDWFGIWRTENFQTNPSIWTNYQEGHEEIVAFTLVAPPQGALLLSGVADVDGFYHERLDTYPNQRFGYKQLIPAYFQDTYSIAYSPTNPLNLVRVGGNRWNKNYSGATSTDGGLTWTKFSSFPADTIPQRVAVSATNPKNFVVTTIKNQPLQTMDGGSSWQTVSGLPKGNKGPWNWSQPLTADQVDGNRFYYYSDGTIYRSDDRGASFQPVNTSLPKAGKNILQTLPKVSGEVWLSLDEQGLYRSQNGGQTLTKISQVEKASLFAFGKSINSQAPPSLYLYGKIANQPEGFFYSPDLGETWKNINNNNSSVGIEPFVLEASKQKPGLIFYGTCGRGIFYRQVTELLNVGTPRS